MNVDDLIHNVTHQAYWRAEHLPQNAEQYVIIETRGQNPSEELKANIKMRLAAESNGVLKPERIRFFGPG